MRLLAVYAIFVVGTAGSGKSTLASALGPWYREKGAHVITVNLDPGVAKLPYTPDVDVRDYVDLDEIMETYELGPNGALVFAADLIASKLPELQDEIESFRATYALVDTPGQMELFAYRSSGPYIVENLRCDGRAAIFIFDPGLISTAVNFVSTALLATSVQLRLGCPQVSVLSKKDLSGHAWKRILRWASNVQTLTDALAEESKDQFYLLSKGIVSLMVRTGYSHALIPTSAVTREGFVELSATLTRILRGGEEIEE